MPLNDMSDMSDMSDTQRLWLIGGASLIILLVVLGLEYLGGLAPCPLCYQQRYAYYAALPLAALGLYLPSWRIAIYWLLAAGFFANAGFGFWHMGIEYHWWPGPQSCAQNWQIPASTQDLQQAVQNYRVVACDEVQFRFAGLSLAGYNMLGSLGLAGIALWRQK